jgi:uncharacterized protein DUF3667
MSDAVETPAVCASCGHPVSGSYCSHCGEEKLDSGKLTLRYFLSHAIVHEFLNLDGKIWRTLGLLLFRPGFLAVEYAAGRRRAYVNPVRVLLVAIIVYVLAQGGTGFTLGSGGLRLNIAPAPVSPERSISGTFSQTDRFGILERMFVERVGSPESASNELRSRFNRMLNVFSTPLSFTAVFLVALTLYACFHRRRSLLVEHVVFAMHYYSFALLTLLLVMLAFRLNAGRLGMTVMLAVLPLVIIWQIVYLARAIRRFYFSAAGNRVAAWTVSGVAAPAVYLLNSLFITVLQFAGAAFAITRL